MKSDVDSLIYCTNLWDRTSYHHFECYSKKKKKNAMAIPGTSPDSFSWWQVTGSLPNCSCAKTPFKFLELVVEPPSWKICSSKLESSPRFGVKIKNAWTPPKSLYKSAKMAKTPYRSRTEPNKKTQKDSNKTSWLVNLPPPTYPPQK